MYIKNITMFIKNKPKNPEKAYIRIFKATEKRAGSEALLITISKWSYPPICRAFSENH
jgi:hypothetical protein